MVRFAPVFVASLLVLPACGGGGGGDRRIGTNPCDEGAACGALSLSLDAVNAGPPADAVGAVALRVAAQGLALAPEPAPWRSSGIISGPPEELRLYVKLIAAAPADGGPLVPIFQSQEARGTLVTLTSGVVDLAGPWPWTASSSRPATTRGSRWTCRAWRRSRGAPPGCSPPPRR